MAPKRGVDSHVESGTDSGPAPPGNCNGVTAAWNKRAADRMALRAELLAQRPGALRQ